LLSPVPNTDCDRAREGASARLDGELGQLDQARLEAHLALCAECREFAAGISAAAGRMRETPLEAAPAGLFTPHRRHVARPRFAAAAAAALVVAAAAGSSFLIGQKMGARGTTQIRTVLAAEGPSHHDPSLVAMLRTRRSWPSQNRRAVAL
jgi:predicted anti-sigma-YlaC factor YlaD